MSLNCFKGKMEIGKTYLDTWGRYHVVYGYVVTQRGWGRHQPDTLDKTRVWAGSGYHFHVKNGECTHRTRQLVQLPRGEEIRFWKARLAQIRSVNHADNLRLIKDDLDQMEIRLKYLSENLF